MTSLPLNMVFNGKRRMNNWKSFGATSADGATIVGQGVVSGNMRPLYNKDPSLNDLGDGNAFKPRPIKHYRRQYADSSNRNRITQSKDLLHNTLTPGGYFVDPASNNCNPCRTFTIVDENYSVNQNKLDNRQANRCDVRQEVNARRRARGANTAINTNPAKPKYYTDTKSYLHSRVKTFKQREFNFASNESTTIKPGSNQASDFTYRTNSCCNSKCNTWTTDTTSTCNSTCSSFSDVSGAVVYYKPNNPGFAQQGAVESGTRMLQLKLDTITKAANNSDNDPTNFFQAGNSIANAVAYSSRTETPFTMKSKYYDVNKCRNTILSRRANGRFRCWNMDGTTSRGRSINR